MLLFCLFAVFSAVSIAAPTEPDPGHVCPPNHGISPSIKYYYDEERMENYPFLYLGCGGNSNRFNSSRTSIIDYTPCPGYGAPNGSCQPWETKQCPAGYSCQNFAPLPLCCNDNDALKFYDNWKAKCPKISPKVQLDPEALTDGREQPLFGRNCSHNFCQKESTCIQGPFLAFCCHA